MKEAYRKRIVDDFDHPKLWAIPFDGTLYLHFVTQNLPLISGLKKAIELFITGHEKSNLLVSSRYIYSMRSCFPAYFSHRERLIFCLNQLRIYNDIEEFKRWALFEDNKEKSFYFSVSVIILSLNNTILKNESPDDFKKIIQELKKINPANTDHMGLIIKDFFLGLCHYLISEYSEAMSYIGPIKSYKGPAALVKAINKERNKPKESLTIISNDQDFDWAA